MAVIGRDTDEIPDVAPSQDVPAADGDLKTTTAAGPAAQLAFAIQQRDVSEVRSACDRAKQFLLDDERINAGMSRETRDRVLAENNDFLVLAPICDKALDGKWDEAASDLREARGQ